MNKKASHVSFAIAFIIFIGFIIFLFGIIKPLGNVETNKDFVLKNLQLKIIENISGNLTIASVYNCSGSLNLSKHYFVENEEINFNDCSGNYEVGFIKREKYIFASKIEDLITNYDSGYNDLKNYFEISNTNDFSLSFTYENGTEINTSEREIPNTDIFVELIPINYFKEDSREEGYLKITLW